MHQTVALTAMCIAVAAVNVQAAEAALELVATIELAGVAGRIDHLAADPARHRLFVAALGNDTVEVVDTQGGKRASIRGLHEPQGVAYVGESNRLFVANGGGDRVDVLEADTHLAVKRIEQLADADNLRHDPAAGTILVGYGKGALAIIDAKSGNVAGRIPLPAHPESFQLEKAGSRVFINVPSARAVIVADRATRELLSSWQVDAGGNYPMALDDAGGRLFVGARSPAVMLVYDARSGRVVARLPIGQDTDDIFFDEKRRRIYVVCGEGRVDVFQQESPDRYEPAGRLATAARARTGLFVPEDDRLYVAAPASANVPARILVYRAH